MCKPAIGGLGSMVGLTPQPPYQEELKPTIELFLDAYVRPLA